MPTTPTQALPWQQAVINKETEVAQDIANLLKFIASDSFKNCSGTEQDLLQQQREAMKRYDEILLERIKGFNLGEDAQQAQV